MTQLDDFIAGNGQTKFEWGKHDCAHFAARWAAARAGKDFLLSFPAWANAKRALRLQQELGGLACAVTSVLGEPIKDAPRDGDIALLPDKLGGLCIVYGAYVVGPAATVGLAFFPFTDAQLFWRLPCQTSQK